MYNYLWFALVFVEFHAFSTETMLWAEIPSFLPVKPSFSSVVAFMFEGADHSFKLVDGVDNRWVDTKLYKDYFTVNENNRFSYKGIVEKLSFDVHPPLYYIILHTLSSIYYGSFSKWLGLIINIVFLIAGIISALLLDKFNQKHSVN